MKLYCSECHTTLAVQRVDRERGVARRHPQQGRDNQAALTEHYRAEHAKLYRAWLGR